MLLCSFGMNFLATAVLSNVPVAFLRSVLAAMLALILMSVTKFMGTLDDRLCAKQSATSVKKYAASLLGRALLVGITLAVWVAAIMIVFIGGGQDPWTTLPVWGMSQVQAFTWLWILKFTAKFTFMWVRQRRAYVNGTDEVAKQLSYQELLDFGERLDVDARHRIKLEQEQAAQKKGLTPLDTPQTVTPHTPAQGHTAVTVGQGQQHAASSYVTQPGVQMVSTAGMARTGRRGRG